MAKAVSVGFKETLKSVTQEQIENGFAVENTETVEENGVKVSKGTGTFAHKGEVSYMFPEDIDEAVQMWGADVVLQKACQMIKIDVGKVAKAGDTAENSQKLVDAYTPGVSRQSSGGSSKKALMAKIKQLTPEDLKSLMEMLKQKAA